MLTKFCQAIVDGVGALFNSIGNLPGSPFEAIDKIVIDNKTMQFLAWVVPFPEIIALLNAWLVAIGIFYVASRVMRVMKMIS